jgi:hypothetical protein
MSDAALEPEGSQRAYQQLLGILRAQTGHGQDVLCTAHRLWRTVGHHSLEASDAETALRAARENDAVLRWRDRQETVRYGLTVAGVAEAPGVELPIYNAADVEGLQRVLEVETDRSEPDRRVVAWANQHLQSIREARDD